MVPGQCAAWKDQRHGFWKWLGANDSDECAMVMSDFIMEPRRLGLQTSQWAKDWHKALTPIGSLASSNGRQWGNSLLQGIAASSKLVPDQGSGGGGSPLAVTGLLHRQPSRAACLGGYGNGVIYCPVHLFSSPASLHQILRVGWFWHMEFLPPFHNPPLRKPWDSRSQLS